MLWMPSSLSSVTELLKVLFSAFTYVSRNVKHAGGAVVAHNHMEKVLVLSFRLLVQSQLLRHRNLLGSELACDHEKHAEMLFMALIKILLAYINEHHVYNRVT